MAKLYEMFLNKMADWEFEMNLVEAKSTPNHTTAMEMMNALDDEIRDGTTGVVV